MKPKILVVEDEEHLAIGLRYNFEAEGYDVVLANDGRAAVEAFRSASPPFDLIVLDLMIPSMSGYEVCQTIRASDPAVPILVLSARSLSEDRTLAFDAGCDQYLTKPFNLRELLSRVRNLLQRRPVRPARSASQENTKEDEIHRFGDAIVNFRTFEVTVDGKPQKLSHLQMQLLRMFLENEGTVLSRNDILQRVWGFDFPPSTTRVVDNAVMELRRTFEKDRSNPFHFQSIRNAGYRFTANPSAVSDAQ